MLQYNVEVISLAMKLVRVALDIQKIYDRVQVLPKCFAGITEDSAEIIE